jgi:hypothetical protein
MPDPMVRVNHGYLIADTLLVRLQQYVKTTSIWLFPKYVI